MDCGISKELFDEIIEYDDSSDAVSEKENTPDNTLIHRKPTTQQYQMMQDFLDKQGNYSDIGKEGYDELWMHLTPKLNDIGPPVHSSLEWRRKWTVYKHNLRKKQFQERQAAAGIASTVGPVEPKVMKPNVFSDRNDHVERQSTACSVTPTQPELQDNFHRRVLDKLDKILSNQDIMIGVQKEILDKLNS